MRQWPVQDAKAHFSEMLETCLAEGPQIVSKRGEAKAVLVPLVEWEYLQKRVGRDVKDILLAPEARYEFDIPPRGVWGRRKPVAFE